MAAGDRLTPFPVPILGDVGLAGAKIYFYAAGTTTPKDTFSDAALTTGNPNPVVCDAGGYPEQDIFLGDGKYKIVVKSSADVTLRTLDNVESNGLSDEERAALATASTVFTSIKTPEEYGALANGTTDDAPAINAALTALSDAGGAVRLSAATYLIASPIRVPSKVSLVGAGIERTTIKVDADNFGTGEAAVQDEPSADDKGALYLSIAGFTIDLNSAPNPEYGLWLSATQRSQVHNVKVENHGHPQGIGFEFSAWNEFGNTRHRATVDIAANTVDVGTSIDQFSVGEQVRVISDITIPGGLASAGALSTTGQQATPYYYVAVIDGNTFRLTDANSPRTVTPDHTAETFELASGQISSFTKGDKVRVTAVDANGDPGTLPAGLTAGDNLGTGEAASIDYYVTEISGDTFKLATTEVLALADTADVAFTDNGGAGHTIGVELYADMTDAGSGQLYVTRYLFRTTNRNHMTNLEALDSPTGMRFSRGPESRNTFGASFNLVERCQMAGYSAVGTHIAYGENNTFILCSNSTSLNNTIAWHIADSVTVLVSCHGDSSFSTGSNKPVPDDAWGFPEGINLNDNIGFYFGTASGGSAIYGFGGNGCQKRVDFADQATFENVNIFRDEYNWQGKSRADTMSILDQLSVYDGLGGSEVVRLSRAGILVNGSDIVARIATLESTDFGDPNNKDPVAVATTANITLSGEQTIDGVLTSASRVLVKDQAAAAQNGIYVSAAGAWTRAADMNTSAEFDFATVYVDGGTVGEGKTYRAVVSGITVGADDVDWVLIDDSSTIAATVSANTAAISSNDTDIAANAAAIVANDAEIATLQADANDLNARAGALSVFPTLNVGGREVAVEKISYDLYLVEGRYIDNGMPWVLGEEYGTSVVFPTVSVSDRTLIGTTWSYDLYALAGFWEDTGESYLGISASADGGGNSPEMYVQVSTDRVDIWARSGGAGGRTYIQTVITHNTDAAKNADVWQIAGVYEASRNTAGAFTQGVAIYRAGSECEFATRIDGKPDFIGGATHGNEEVQDVYLLVDGAEVALDAAMSMEAAHVVLAHKSHCFEVGAEGFQWSPKGDHIWTLWRQTTFEPAKGGLQITYGGYLEHVIDGFTIDNAYIGMAPIYRIGADAVTQISDTAARSPKFEQEDVSASGFTATLDTAERLHVWGDRYSVEVEILAGFDDAGRSITVSPSVNYNKIYPDFFGGQVTTTSDPWDWSLRSTIRIMEA